MVNGQPAFNGVGTLLDWKTLGIDPIKSIKANCAKISRRFVPTQDDIKTEPIALVAYGGSLQDTWREIKGFKTIFTCSGAHEFLLDRDIMPSFHVDSDPRPHKVGMLGEPLRWVTYMVASICDPGYADFLISRNIPEIILWHLFFMEPDILGVMPRDECMITGGDTVGPRMMKIARLMGYTNFDFFGFDASARSSVETHASYHPNPRTKLTQIKYEGKKYITTDDWEVQAQMLINDLDRMPEIAYRFHGEGLLQAMVENHVPMFRSRRPLMVETYAAN